MPYCDTVLRVKHGSYNKSNRGRARAFQLILPLLIFLLLPHIAPFTQASQPNPDSPQQPSQNQVGPTSINSLPKSEPPKPLGRDSISREFIERHFPIALQLPAGYAAPPPEIDEELAAKLATAKAKWLWGENVQLGSVIPLTGPDGGIWGYDVDFTIDGSLFGTYLDVASEWREYCLSLENTHQTPSNQEASEESFIEPGCKKYGSVTVTATYDAPPIRSSRKGVSSFYAAGWLTLKIAQEVLGIDDPQLMAVYFVGSWERSYEFRNGSRSIVVEGHEPWSWYDGDKFRELSRKGLKGIKDYITGEIQKAGIDISAYLDSVRNANRIELENWLNQRIPERSPESLHFIPGYNTYFTPLFWFGGCSPTSGAMILNYWDERAGYGKLNRYFQTTNDPVDGLQKCHVASLQVSLRDFMNTRPDGATRVDSIYPGMRNYANAQGYCFSGGPNWWSGNPPNQDWHWNESVIEINNGYPFVWSLNFYPGAGDHSVAVVGYEDISQDFGCYNTGDAANHGNQVEWVHHAGGPFDWASGAAPHPGCLVSYKVKLVSPDGFQTYSECGYSGTITGGQTAMISWTNHGNPGAFVYLYYSTNGGIDWNFITSTTDDGSYTWSVPCGISTTQGRIRIQQFIFPFTMVSSDGSYGDFRIDPGNPCSIWPTSLYFGTVCLGNFNDQSFTITNTGCETLSGNISESCPEFSIITSTDYSLDPGQSKTFTVRLTPLSLGYKSCTIETGNSLCSDVSCSGTGVNSIPLAPSNCVASGTLCGYVHFCWQDNSNNEGSFKIYRNGTYIGSQGPNSTCYDDHNGAPGQTYNYCITASNGCGESIQCCDSGASLAETVVVIAPNGGEAWCAGSVHDIAWNSSVCVSGSVKIQYSTDGGSTWETIVGSTPNDGSYSWTVPSIPSPAWRVKVSESDGDTYDISDSNFAINSAFITVSFPKGGEDWCVGSVHDITWTSNCILGNVKIEYSKNGGNRWKTIEESTANDGSYSWTVPDDDGDECLVRVSDLNGQTYDVSDTDFAITEECITVISPNGGENLGVGSIQNITWSCSNFSSNVDVMYSTDGGSNWMIIEEAIQHSDSCSWTVPNTPSTACRVKVSEHHHDFPYDASDSNFTISGETIVDTSSNGGVSSHPPEKFELSQNYPNPFNPETKIHYALSKHCIVKLTIYNLLGQKIRVLVDEHQLAGYKQVDWDGKDDQGKEVTSGIYFYRIQAGDFVQSKKMALIK